MEIFQYVPQKELSKKSVLLLPFRKTNAYELYFSKTWKKIINFIREILDSGQNGIDTFSPASSL